MTVAKISLGLNISRMYTPHKMYSTISLILIFTVLSRCSNLEEMLNLDDILRADLMPSSLMMIEGPVNEKPMENSTKTNDKSALSSNGSWYEAYATMGFHRKMLNEYLCRNFVADEILTQIHRPLISNRIGKPFEHKKPKDDYPPASNRKSRAELSDVKEDLLSDPGSSNYRNWLTKTTTLEDIYRHYEKEQPISRNSDDSDVEYEGGEITGYAMPGPQHDFGPYAQGMSNQQESEKHGGGYDFMPHHVHFHNADDEGEKSSGLSLPDVFDVSLTALAFLSFGIFILQVIMCISMNKTPQMMQMVDNTGDTENFDQIRYRRDLPGSQTSLNELAKRVLISIETGLIAENDEGVCLRRTLCENNKYSRTLVDNQKLWVPVWGLGMSWLSGRFIQSQPSSTVMLESLRACALGLANADCASLYSNCNLKEVLKEPNGRSRKLSQKANKEKGDSGYK